MQIKVLSKKLIISILIVMMLFQIIMQNNVYAGKAEVSTKIKEALFSIICLPADGVMNLLQSSMLGINGKAVRTLKFGQYFDRNMWQTEYNDFVEAMQVYAKDYFAGTATVPIGRGDRNPAIANVNTMTYKLENDMTGNESWVVPNIIFSPELIFSGLVPLFNIDFLSSGTSEKLSIFDYEINATDSGEVLHKSVQNWFKTLRTFSLVALLSILIYAGIKIVLSSVAEQKAKYKEMLKDWIVALIMILTINYIMVAAIEISKALTDMINDNNELSFIYFSVGVTDTSGSEVVNVSMNKQQNTEDDEDDQIKQIIIFSSRFIGTARFYAGEGRWTYLLIYLILVVFTVRFSWVYLKRVLYLAFLTVLAPLVAFSYPLDKIGDGQAQSFSFWLKEYIYNVMVQPLHLLTYTIIVNAAEELAKTNPIYAIVAIGSIIPFEGLVKQMLGFNKAQKTSELAEGAMVGTLASTLYRSAKGLIPKGGNSKTTNKDNSDIRFQRKTDTEYKDRNPFMQGVPSINNSFNSNQAEQISNNINDYNNISNALDSENNNVQERLIGDNNASLGQSSTNTESLNSSNDENEEQNRRNNQTRIQTLYVENLMANNTQTQVQNNNMSIKDLFNDNNKEDLKQLLKEKLNLSDEAAEKFVNIAYDFKDTRLGRRVFDGIDRGAGRIDNTGGNITFANNSSEPTIINMDNSENVNGQTTANNYQVQMPEPPSIPNTQQEDDEDLEMNFPQEVARPIPAANFRGRRRAIRREAAGNIRAAIAMTNRNRIRFVGNAFKHVAQDTGKAGIRLVGKAPLAAMLGVYGLAIGVATGDPNKALGLAAGGAIAGGHFAGNINDRLAGEIKELHDNDKEVYQRALYGENYSELQNIKLDKEFMKDEKIDEAYRKEFKLKPGESVLAYNQRLKRIKQRALEFRKHGITDDKVIMKAIKLQDKHRGQEEYEGENIYDIAKFAMQCPKNQEGMLAFENRLVNGYSRYFDEETAEEKAKLIMDAIEEMRK